VLLDYLHRRLHEVWLHPSILHFLRMVKVQHNINVAIVHVDNDTVLINKATRADLAQVSTVFEPSTVYTSQLQMQRPVLLQACLLLEGCLGFHQSPVCTQAQVSLAVGRSSCPSL
jgi:hypothetical protein